MKTILLSLWFLSLNAVAEPRACSPDAELEGNPWQDSKYTSYWKRKFSSSASDQKIAVPKGEPEAFGKKSAVVDEQGSLVFNRWSIDRSLNGGRATEVAAVSPECKGDIEIDFALTPETWASEGERKKYYKRIDALIMKIGRKLLADFDTNKEIIGQEKADFLRALKTLAWQETHWHHYFRFQDWFFVILSGGSYNALDDWGITQVARSDFKPANKLNAHFFAQKGHCSISNTLYYGFLEYYFSYKEARKEACNKTAMEKLLGAYNLYSSGCSICFDARKLDDAGFSKYQDKALAGFSEKFLTAPWEKLQ